jgi:hypothetical protein
MARFGATRRERFVEGAGKLGLALAPSELVALLWLVLGAPATAVAFAVIGGLIGICVATSVRTRRGALAGGLATVLFLLAIAFVANWLADNPILPGSAPRPPTAIVLNHAS